MVLSIILMTLDYRTDTVRSIRSGLSVIVYPVQYLVDLPGSLISWTADTFVTRDTLQKENSTLRTQNQILKAQLQKFTFIEAENVHLRELLQSSKRVGERMLIAELLSVDLDPFRRQVVINKGSMNDDLYVSQPLLDADGIMGKIVHIYPLTSTAILITDPDHSLPVQVARNGLRTIAVGTGSDNQLELLYLPNNADIQIGDDLITSGLGCVFPAGYPVARVTAVNTNPSLPFAQVLAEPTAKLDRSREVLLVWPSHASLPEMQTPCTRTQEEKTP